MLVIAQKVQMMRQSQSDGELEASEAELSDIPSEKIVKHKAQIKQK